MIRIGWLSGILCLILLMTAGCSSLGRSDQELMGEGIVRGTIGSQADGHVRLLPQKAASISGQVLELEGGAYLIQPIEGGARQLPLDENTKIDRPAHVGDRIQAWLDEGGRAVLIRNIDHE
jgi:hypothetical protein